MVFLDIQKKRDFITQLVYWAIVAGGVYLGLEYLLPVSVPFIIGILIAWLVVRISDKLRCPNRILRIGLSLLIYGILGFLIVLLSGRGISAMTDIIKWLPQLYEHKLQPFVTRIYQWIVQSLQMLDPTVVSVLEMVVDSVLNSVKNLITNLSGSAVDLISGLATAVPNLVLSLLAMVFSTIFLVGDYERITSFLNAHTPAKLKGILKDIRFYLSDTLFVVIRSYLLIMLITFLELSILFSICGIEKAVLKASLIALFDIMPILGTGGIMIPWIVISLVLGHVKLGLKLLLIYTIVTVVRNYIEPKIVGAQLGLHSVVTLVSMFIGLRLFGFWGLFGLPVGISYLWKKKTASAPNLSAQ